MVKLKLETSKSNLVLYVLLILSFGFFAFQVYGKSIEGLFLFNPSAGVIPFQVDASKTGKVNNLNADRVDDLHAADLLAAGGGAVIELTCGWLTTGAPPPLGSCSPPPCPAAFPTDVATTCHFTGVSCNGTMTYGCWYYTGLGNDQPGGASGLCKRICAK